MTSSWKLHFAVLPVNLLIGLNIVIVLTAMLVNFVNLAHLVSIMIHQTVVLSLFAFRVIVTGMQIFAKLKRVSRYCIHGLNLMFISQIIHISFGSMYHRSMYLST